jgi:hypothetical protein
MRFFDILFEDVLVPMIDDCQMPGMDGISPTRKVPCLFNWVSFTAACNSLAGEDAIGSGIFNSAIRKDIQ